MGMLPVSALADNPMVIHEVKHDRSQPLRICRPRLNQLHQPRYKRPFRKGLEQRSRVLSPIR
jgi:hypothetical protein